MRAGSDPEGRWIMKLDKWQAGATGVLEVMAFHKNTGYPCTIMLPSVFSDILLE